MNRNPPAPILVVKQGVFFCLGEIVDIQYCAKILKLASFVAIGGFFFFFLKKEKQIFSPVIVPDYFQRNFYLFIFVCLISHLTLTCELFKNRRAQLSVVSAHNKQLSKEPILKYISSHFITCCLSQKHRICAHLLI